jgi:hypothetical protein
MLRRKVRPTAPSSTCASSSARGAVLSGSADVLHPDRSRQRGLLEASAQRASRHPGCLRCRRPGHHSAFETCALTMPRLTPPRSTSTTRSRKSVRPDRGAATWRSLRSQTRSVRSAVRAPRRAHPFPAGPPVWPNGGDQSNIKDGTSVSFDSTGDKPSSASAPSDSPASDGDSSLRLSGAASRPSGPSMAPALADLASRCAAPVLLSLFALVSVFL